MWGLCDWRLTALNRSKPTFPAPSSPEGFTLRLSHLCKADISVSIFQEVPVNLLRYWARIERRRSDVTMSNDRIQESLQTGNMSHPADMSGSYVRKREKECVNRTQVETITTLCSKESRWGKYYLCRVIFCMPPNEETDKKSQIRWILDEPPHSATSSYIFLVLLCDSSQLIYW